MNKKRNFEKLLLSFVISLMIAIAGCSGGGHSAISNPENEKIVSEIKTDISNHPAPKDFETLTSALYSLCPEAFEKIAKEYFEETSKVWNIIENSENRKASYLSGQSAEFETALGFAKKYFKEKDWLNTYLYSESALEEGYYLLPYYTPDEKLDSLFKTMLEKYDDVKKEEKETVNKLLEIERNPHISKDSWLNISYPESITDDIENNFYKQMDQFVSGYKNAKSSRSRDFPADVTMARNLGSGLSDLQMMKDKLQLANMVVNNVKSGEFSFEKRKSLLDKYKKLASSEISVSKADKKSWGERLLYFSRSSYDAGSDYEKKNFSSFALVLYQAAYVFAEISKDWAHYPDTIHYYSPKEEPPPLDKLLYYRDESVKMFYETENTLNELSKQGKLCFNIRYLDNIFYKSWFSVGDGFLKEFVKRKGHWVDMGNIAYLNIGPVPHALKILMRIENSTCER